MTSDQLQALAAAATAVVSVVLAYQTYRYVNVSRDLVNETTRKRQVDTFLHVERLMDDIRGRRVALLQFPRDFKDWNHEQRQVAFDVSISLQHVAYLCWKGLLDPELVIESWGKVFDDCWTRLEHFIEAHRLATGTPEQRKHLELFVKEQVRPMRAKQNAGGAIRM